MSKKVITKLFVRDEEFHIVYHMDRYCAINTKYLDENGCTTKVLNGLDMHARETLQECIDEVRMSVEVQHMIAQGMTVEEALRTYYNMEKEVE